MFIEVVQAGTVNVPKVPSPYVGFVPVALVSGSVIEVAVKPAERAETQEPVGFVELI